MKRKRSSTRYVKRRKGTPRYYRRYKKKYSRFANNVMNVIRSKAETKYITTYTTGQAVLHNNYQALLTNMCGTSVGTSQNNRLGDCVQPKGMSIKMWVSNSSLRKNVIWRLMVIRTPRAEVASTAPPNFWSPQGQTSNNIIDYINTDYYKVVKQRILHSKDFSTINNDSTNREYSHYIKWWIPLKGTLKYGPTDGAVYPMGDKYCYSLFVCAYDTALTLSTDILGSVASSCRFYFNDF